MKTLSVLLATLLLSACNPTFDQPPLLHAGGAAAVVATQHVAAQHLAAAFAPLRD